jgi:hypothetical protein
MPAKRLIAGPSFLLLFRQRVPNSNNNIPARGARPQQTEEMHMPMRHMLSHQQHPRHLTHADQPAPNLPLFFFNI